MPSLPTSNRIGDSTDQDVPVRIGAECYLTVAGIVTAENHLELQPGYLTEYGERASSGDLAAADPAHVLTIEVADGEGQPILREHIQASPICSYPGGSSGGGIRGQQDPVSAGGADPALLQIG